MPGLFKIVDQKIYYQGELVAVLHAKASVVTLDNLTQFLLDAEAQEECVNCGHDPREESL